MSHDAPKLNFEQALEQLQGNVKGLEGGELSLEESLKRFEEGIRLGRLCHEVLKEAEQKVELLTRASDSGISVTPFPSAERALSDSV